MKTYKEIMDIQEQMIDEIQVGRVIDSRGRLIPITNKTTNEALNSLITMYDIKLQNSDRYFAATVGYGGTPKSHYEQSKKVCELELMRRKLSNF